MLHSLTIRRKNITNKKKNSFQVLIDDRDQPFIKHRNLPESVTFLRNGDPSEKNRSLYAISGLDYVAHEDIIPYKSKDKVPIHHELFDKFLGE